ncbi:hypothetical protein JST97_36400 [bacterium]|nr:hypothetical protein [bacterium]
MISLPHLGGTSLTPLASFNAFALSLAAYRHGELEEELLARDFASFQTEMSQISTVFRSEVRFQELQGPWLDWIESALERLECAEDQAYLLSEADWGQARVETAARALNELFEAFAELRKLEEARPRLAASPYIHELLRCLELYDRGMLSAALVHERLAGVTHHFQSLAEQMRQSPVRLPAVEQLLDLLEIQEEALQSLADPLLNGLAVPQQPRKILQDCAAQALIIHTEVQALAGTPASWCDGCLGLVRVTREGRCQECGHGLLRREEGLGLLDLAQRACLENRPEDWEALPSLTQQAQTQASELLKKARALPESQPELEEAIQQMQEALGQVRDCLASRDGPALERFLPALRERLERAAELQRKVLDEARTGRPSA